MSAHLHGCGELWREATYPQGLMASSQLLVPSSPESQPLTISLPLTRPLLRWSKDATMEVGQVYVLNTFDLGGMKVVWRPFHWSGNFQISTRSMWSFQGRSTLEWIIWTWWQKTNTDSGYSEILLEAELLTTDCLSCVWKGKTYLKALLGLKTVIEAIQRLLFERFAEEKNVETFSPVVLLNLVRICNREILDLALLDPVRSPPWRDTHPMKTNAQ